LIETDQLMAFQHEGFWRPMDTLKDKQVLEDLVGKGTMPWRFEGASRSGLERRGEEGWMKHLRLAGPGERLSVLCIGAHSDDIEIGAGTTILGWIDPGAGSIAESVDDVAQGSGAHSKSRYPHLATRSSCGKDYNCEAKYQTRIHRITH
jgi:hypothetical protein